MTSLEWEHEAGTGVLTLGLPYGCRATVRGTAWALKTADGRITKGTASTPVEAQAFAWNAFLDQLKIRGSMPTGWVAEGNGVFSLACPCGSQLRVEGTKWDLCLANGRHVRGRSKDIATAKTRIWCEYTARVMEIWMETGRACGGGLMRCSRPI